jgi:hypothetical protein
MSPKLNSVPGRSPNPTPLDNCEFEWLLCLASKIQEINRTTLHMTEPTNILDTVLGSAYPKRYGPHRSSKAS